MGMGVKTRVFDVKGHAVVLVHFEFDEPIEPSDAPIFAYRLYQMVHVESLRAGGPSLVVVSGRGPIWFYGAVLHRLAHVYPAVAFYDPKLRGAVVVSSHTHAFREGEVVPVGP